jgi:hypothetical protein
MAPKPGELVPPPPELAPTEIPAPSPGLGPDATVTDWPEGFTD